MSDYLNPTIKLLKRLGFNLPIEDTKPTPDEEKKYRFNAQKEIDEAPLWKKTINAGISGLVGATKGFIGIDPDKDNEGKFKSDFGSNINKLTQLGSSAEGIVKGGLPFLLSNKGKSILHGTGKVFKTINPEKFDTTDALGRFFHGSNSSYADEYAKGAMKGGGIGHKDNMISIVPEAENVLDLVNPNMDDLSHALAAVPRYERDRLIHDFKLERGNDKVKGLAQSLEREFNKPGTLEKTQFDAIKYNDMSHPSYAIPDTTLIKTPWGVSMNNPPKKIDVHRMDERSEAFKTGVDRPSGHISHVDPYDEMLKKQYDKPKITYKTADKDLTDEEWYTKNQVTQTKIKNDYNPSLSGNKTKEESYDFGPNYGHLTKKEAMDLVLGGELKLSQVENKFGFDSSVSNKPTKAEWDEYHKFHGMSSTPSESIIDEKLPWESSSFGNKSNKELTKPKWTGDNALSDDEFALKYPEIYGNKQKPTEADLNEQDFDNQFNSDLNKHNQFISNFTPHKISKSEQDAIDAANTVQHFKTNYPTPNSGRPSKLAQSNIITPSPSTLSNQYEPKILQSAGGSHGANIIQDAYGNKNIFKPMHPKGEIPLLAEEYGSKIANQINSSTPIAKSIIDPTFGKGSIQPYSPNSSTISQMHQFNQSDMPALTKEHQIDWLIGNHDAHLDQFLRGEKGNIIPVDKGQSWKFWNDEKLDPSFHPNKSYGARPPVYSQIGNKIDKDQAIDIAKDIQTKHSPMVMDLGDQFAKLRFGSNTKEYSEFMKHMEKKLNNLHVDVGKYWNMPSPY